MKWKVYLIAALAMLLGAGLYIQFEPKSAAISPGVSGRLVQGYRILSVENSDKPVDLIVYRGDYIKFDIDPSIKDPLLRIPALSIEQRLGQGLSEAPYFKMKANGRFPFFLGNVSGRIEVVDYRPTNYAEVDPQGAVELMASGQPLILDVRTSAEYKGGHLQGAVLIPVQELQKRLEELVAYKERYVLVYCATGNRSTVASKILIDNGFQQIVNMRQGIAGWTREKFPIVR